MSEPESVVIKAQPRPSITAMAQAVVSAAWLLGIAMVFFITWVSPYALGERMVYNLCFVMIIEFFVVHATGFFGGAAAGKESLPARVVMYGGLTLFYSIFALAFSAAYGGLFPLYALLGLLLPKLAGVLLQPPDADAHARIMTNWAAMTAIYIAAVIGTVIVPVPAFGITPEVIASQEFTMTGAWPEEPYRVLAAGTLYFLGLAILSLVEPFIARTAKPRPDAPAPVS